MFPIQQLISNPQMFQVQLNNFMQNMQQRFGNNINPQQLVQNLLNSGQLTQERFNQFRDIANRLTGKRL